MDLKYSEIEGEIFDACEEDFPLRFPAEDLNELIMVFHETGYIRYPEIAPDGFVYVFEDEDTHAQRGTEGE